MKRKLFKTIKKELKENGFITNSGWGTKHLETPLGILINRVNCNDATCTIHREKLRGQKVELELTLFQKVLLYLIFLKIERKEINKEKAEIEKKAIDIINENKESEETRKIATKLISESNE